MTRELHVSVHGVCSMSWCVCGVGAAGEWHEEYDAHRWSLSHLQHVFKVHLLDPAVPAAPEQQQLDDDVDMADVE